MGVGPRQLLGGLREGAQVLRLHEIFLTDGVDLAESGELVQQMHHLVAVQGAVAGEQVGELGRVDASFVQPGPQALPERLLVRPQGHFVARQPKAGAGSLQGAVADEFTQQMVEHRRPHLDG